MYGKKGCGCGSHGHHGHHGQHHQMAMPVPGCNKVNVCPPVVHQPIQFVKQNTFTHIVPHVHPVQTTEINNHLFKHERHVPHTYQSASNVSNQQCSYGSPMPPRPGCC